MKIKKSENNKNGQLFELFNLLQSKYKFLSLEIKLIKAMDVCWQKN